MLIPIGHEEESVRRLPWVTFSIMAVCIVSLILVQQVAGSEADATDDATEAFEYYLYHPYLELDEDFQKLVLNGMSDEEQEALMSAFEGQYLRPSDPDDLRREQERLDELVKAAMSFVDDHPFYRFGLVPGDISFFALFTHMFMHAGLLHLIGNLLILYLAGPFVEDVWGRGVFAAFYFSSGLAAAFIYMAFSSGSGIPMVGASGAIAGVMGAFLVRYWNTKIRFFYMFGLLIRGTFDAAAWVMLPLWFGQQLFYAVFFTRIVEQSGGGVAYWAHVGGFAFGVAGALAIKHWKVDQRFEEKIADQLEATVVDNSEIERALDMNANGNAEEALKILAEQARQHPRNHDAALAYWGLACEHRREVEAAPAMVQLIRDEMRSGHHEMALSHWAEVVNRVPTVPAEPDLMIRIAQLHGQNQQWEMAASALRRALMSGGDRDARRRGAPDRPGRAQGRPAGGLWRDPPGVGAAGPGPLGATVGRNAASPGGRQRRRHGQTGRNPGLLKRSASLDLTPRSR